MLQLMTRYNVSINEIFQKDKMRRLNESIILILIMHFQPQKEIYLHQFVNYMA